MKCYFYLCYTLRLQLWCPNYALLIRVQAEATDSRHIQLFLLLIKVKDCHTSLTGCITQHATISAGRKADNSLLNSYQALSGEELRCQGQTGRHLEAHSSVLKYVIDTCHFLIFKAYLVTFPERVLQNMIISDWCEESCKSRVAEKWGSILICPISAFWYLKQ